MDQRLKPAGEAPWIPEQGPDDEEEVMKIGRAHV